MVDGHAEGFGMLYSENGKLIYEGGFSDDMYCGQGKNCMPKTVPLFI